MRTTWSEEELKLALNIAEDPTLTWREIAEALYGRGYPKRSPGSVSVLLRNKGAPLRETDSGEPVGNKGGGHHRRPPRRFRRFRRILRAARCRLSLRRLRLAFPRSATFPLVVVTPLGRGWKLRPERDPASRDRQPVGPVLVVARAEREVRRASRAEVIRTIRAALDRLEAADG